MYDGFITVHPLQNKMVQTLHWTKCLESVPDLVILETLKLLMRPAVGSKETLKVKNNKELSDSLKHAKTVSKHDLY